MELCQMKKHILFIINPIAGKGNFKKCLERIQHSDCFRQNHCEYAITRSKGHATAVAKASSGTKDILVAVGGDGTVNEVINGMDLNRQILGILPRGSGNGLAISLGLPMNLEKALGQIHSGDTRQTDLFELNERKGINVAGAGFDGYVAKLFNENRKRGFLTYASIVLKEFSRFPSQEYLLTIDNTELKINVFLVSFANSTQFGNHAYIAPQALIDDGLIDICLLKKVPLSRVPDILTRLFTRRIQGSDLYQAHTAKTFRLESERQIFTHIDGEYVETGKVLDCKVLPGALRVLA